jgi:hypothetical protein
MMKVPDTSPIDLRPSFDHNSIGRLGSLIQIERLDKFSSLASNKGCHGF